VTTKPRTAGELARQIEWRVWRAVLVANLVGVLFIAFDAASIAPVLPHIDSGRFVASPTRLATLCGVAAFPYFVFAASMGILHVRRRIRPVMQWLAEGREPVEEERLELTGQPRKLAAYPLIYWGILPFWALPFLYYVVGFRPGVFGLAKVAVAFGLSALVSFALAYFLVERELRPALALAYATDPPAATRSMGMVGRIVLAWAAASGTPLVAIAVTMIGLTPEQRASTAPFIWGISVLGMLAGLLVAATAARAINDPLVRVREGLRNVEGGDLDFEVTVDESGELGLLQVGFNRMVAGLRDRERVRDVFGRHVGAEVAERALAQEFALGGELCEATTMFVDVIASTRLAQTRLPQDVVIQLNEFFDAVIRAVEAEGGLVNQFQGDGVLCVFGAPGEQPGHASCALRAARSLRTEIETLRPGGLDAAIGVSSGKVVAGNVGGMHRYEFTIVGDSVNEASRLTEYAKTVPSRTLVSNSTIVLADDERSNWREAGRLQLRGREKPTDAFEPST
jgi:adenylate cyclase